MVESGRHRMHLRLSKQTQHKLQIVFIKCCLHITSTEELTGITCLTLCLSRYPERLAMLRQQAQLVPMYFSQ